MSDNTTILKPMESTTDGFENFDPECQITFNEHTSKVEHIQGRVNPFSSDTTKEEFHLFLQNDATRITVIEDQYQIIILDLENVPNISVLAIVMFEVIRLASVSRCELQLIQNKDISDYTCIALHVSDAGMLR